MKVRLLLEEYFRCLITKGAESVAKLGIALAPSVEGRGLESRVGSSKD